MTNKYEDQSLIGTIIKGRYCVLEKLGKGGQGKLYLVRDIELGILWAMKEMPSNRKKEARFLRILSHPSLPKMIDYAERGDKCYLIMEYIKGNSLGELQREHHKLSVEKIIEYAIETAEVLHYLHNIKPPVYYADLKPDNLLISESGKLYLVDFGSAVFGYRANHRQTTGTVGFAAPEQYKGITDEKSDIYTFGRTFQSLLGKRRFLYYLKEPNISWIFWKCTKQNPKKRYSSIGQVKKQLEKSRLKKKKSISKDMWGVTALILLLLISNIWMVSISRNSMENRGFYHALTEVTDLYGQMAFVNGSAVTRNKICTQAERKLKTLLKTYKKNEEQRKLLQLLAINGEWLENEKADFYYRQLLLYEDSWRESYVSYGIYLWKQEKKRQSLSLWEEYQNKERNGALEGEAGPNYRIWEECIHEYTKEMEKS